MTSDRTPVANIAPFGLRMQPDLKARVEEAARRNNRSMNAEIVHRIEQSLWLESAGVIGSETTVADLVQPVSRDKLLDAVRAMQAQTKALLLMVEADRREDDAK